MCKLGRNRKTNTQAKQQVIRVTLQFLSTVHADDGIIYTCKLQVHIQFKSAEIQLEFVGFFFDLSADIQTINSQLPTIYIIIFNQLKQHIAKRVEFFSHNFIYSNAQQKNLQIFNGKVLDLFTLIQSHLFTLIHQIASLYDARQITDDGQQYFTLC